MSNVPLQLVDAANALDLSVQKYWLKGSDKFETFYDKYFNVETGVSDYYLKDAGISGLGYAARIVENAAIVAQSPVETYKQTYTQVQYGKIVSFSKHIWYFGIKKRKVENIVDEARQACVDLRELRCADRLDNSFSTSYSVSDDAGSYTALTAGGDSLAMISASHTREDGGTVWGNRVTDGSTVNMAFEYNGLKAAIRTASLITNPVGKPTNINLDTLVVTRGQAPHLRAMEILGAINKGWIPGSADRDGSAVPAFKILALPWITTNTGYWWMFDSTKKNDKYGLQYKESQGIELEGPNVVFKTGEIQYKATMMFDIGFNDARNWVGSKSTGVT